MNNSDSTMRDPEQPSQQAVWLRAIISAAVFGSIGAVVGRWLGKRGNDRQTRFAESVMTWSMGTFCGLLASYSTFKAAEQRKDDPTEIHHAHATPPRIAEESPAHMATLDELTHEGKIHAHGPQSVIEK